MSNQTFLDIVFERRNKEYGAYQLRQIASNDLMKSLFVGIGFIALTTGGILFANKPTKINIKDEKSVTAVICELNFNEKKPKETVAPPIEKIAIEKKTKQAPTEQIEHILPTPKENPIVEKTVQAVNDLEKADLGAFNRKGNESAGQVGGGEVSEIGSTVGRQNTNAIEGPKETKPVENTNKTITTRLAAVMAIYPGCESESKKGNDALTKCMSDKISKELSFELADFAETATKQNLNSAVAKMQFIVNRNGEISQVKPLSGSQQDLGKEAKTALERINKQLIRKGKKIKPAQLEDGTDANLIFSIPVKFQTVN